MSDFQDDELLSIAVMRRGTKAGLKHMAFDVLISSRFGIDLVRNEGNWFPSRQVICGTQTGGPEGPLFSHGRVVQLCWRHVAHLQLGRFW